MKTVQLTCQNCGANLEVKENIAFCSYCGAKLVIDDENRTYTHNYNYTHTQRDEARIRENERKEKIQFKLFELLQQRHKENAKQGPIIAIVFAVIIVAIFLVFGISQCTAQSQGKITAGYSYEYVDENYEAVVEQFEAMGFTDIIAIDLKDSEEALSNDNKVKSVSIKGNSNFGEYDYFFPDDKVIIKYH